MFAVGGALDKLGGMIGVARRREAALGIPETDAAFRARLAVALRQGRSG